MTVDLIEDQETSARSLGEILIKWDKISRADLERAVRLRAETSESLHIILTKLGLVSELDMARALSACLDIPLASEEDYPTEPVHGDQVSTAFLRNYRVIPLDDTPERLRLAMADPLDDYAVAAMELAFGKTVAPEVGLPAHIESVFDRLYLAGKTATDQLVEETVDDVDATAEEDIERLKDLASEAPVIRLVNLLITNAVERRASDIHIEACERRLRIRYRIDGVLLDVDAPPQRLQPAIVSRIKVMANLNIAERRLPQDGRIKLTVRGRDVDMRISVIPTAHGECVVMRLLDRGSIELDFQKLGFTGSASKRFRDVLSRPHGIILVTGPTGSGKTTTLYTCLLELNTSERKILTIEDPIEYLLDGVIQVQVKPNIGLSFASSLRAFLRQDPDILMIGEIRDLETAQIAVQSALTGHLVLSTLHTNDAVSSITRLLDMGVEDYLLTSTIAGIGAQRLVRKLCRDCRKPCGAPSDLPRQEDFERLSGDQGITFYEPGGCDQCNGTGYRERTTIMEFLEMSDPVRSLVMRHAEAHEIRRDAVERGMHTMFDDGMRKAIAGITTMDEVFRVTQGQ